MNKVQHCHYFCFSGTDSKTFTFHRRLASILYVQLLAVVEKPAGIIIVVKSISGCAVIYQQTDILKQNSWAHSLIVLWASDITILHKNINIYICRSLACVGSNGTPISTDTDKPFSIPYQTKGRCNPLLFTS